MSQMNPYYGGGGGYGYNSPYNTPYNFSQPGYSERLQQMMMEQQQQHQQPQQSSQYGQQNNVAQMRQQPFECRPVTAIEEARATPTDFSGKPMFFWNAAANEVYIKQLDMNTGSSFVKVFSIKEPQSQQQAPQPMEQQIVSNPPMSYVSKEEFDNYKIQMEQLIEGLKEKKKQPVIPASAPSAAAAKQEQE